MIARQPMLSEKRIAEMQLVKLKRLVHYLYNNSPYNQKKMEKAGVRPEDLNTLEDIARFPFTEKQELRDLYPDKLMIASEEEIVRLHASSGTTGKKTVTFYSKQDLDTWSEMMARCLTLAGVTNRDRLQITSGYGLWTAGAGFQAGAERIGALVMPVGPIAMEQQLELMIDFGTTVLVSTSSYALLLGEQIAARGLRDKIKLRIGIVGSERWSDAMRLQVEKLLGIETFDIIGMTETYGPGTGLDCKLHDGIHYWADHLLFEIIDPVTGIPCQPGEEGELVVTTLNKQANPLLRYRTRDITSLIPEPCACGLTYPRIKRLVGRSDDMIKFRAVNIYPGQIDHVISEVSGLSSEYQIRLFRVQGRDVMIVRVEAEQGSKLSNEQLASVLQKQIKITINVTPDVEVVDYGSLPRSEKKTKRVFDERE